MVRLIVDDKYRDRLTLTFPEANFFSIIKQELGKALFRETFYEIEFCLNDPTREFYAEQSLINYGINYTITKSSMPKH